MATTNRVYELKDWLNAINWTKESPFEEDYEQADKDYSPWIINICLSAFPDCILQVNEMNRHHGLSHKMQFDYLRHAIKRKKRFSPWTKKESLEDLEVVKQFFQFSDAKAREALEILTDAQLAEIKERMDAGGKRK
jgi:hypothetical protein